MDVSGSAAVMALVLAETVAGATVLLWLSPLWNEVRHGFFKLVGAILAVAAVTTWLVTRAAQVSGDEAGAWSVALALATAAASVVATALLFARRETAARAIGVASGVPAVATLVPMALTGAEAAMISLYQLVAGAALLGSVTVGLLLGHWYLTDRKLPRRPIDRATTALLASIVFVAAAIVVGGFEATSDTSVVINPLLTTAGLAPWIALGMVGSTLLIGILVKATLRGERASAVQSATGFFYLAVVTAFTAEVAVKTRFLG
jgi:hypothetical protein